MGRLTPGAWSKRAWTHWWQSAPKARPPTSCATPRATAGDTVPETQERKTMPPSAPCPSTMAAV